MLLSCVCETTGALERVQRPAESVPLARVQNAIVRAWRGDPTVLQRPIVDDQIEETGFLASEMLLICYPLRFSYGSINPPSWGVLRLGVAENPQDFENFWNSEKPPLR